MSVLTLRGSNPPSLPILVSSVPHTQITYHHHHHLFSMEGTGLAVEGRTGCYRIIPLLSLIRLLLPVSCWPVWLSLPAWCLFNFLCPTFSLCYFINLWTERSNSVCVLDIKIKSICCENVKLCQNCWLLSHISQSQQGKIPGQTSLSPSLQHLNANKFLLSIVRSAAAAAAPIFWKEPVNHPQLLCPSLTLT